MQFHSVFLHLYGYRRCCSIQWLFILLIFYIGIVNTFHVFHKIDLEADTSHPIHPMVCILIHSPASSFTCVCVSVCDFYNDMHSVHFNNHSSHSIRKQLNKRQVEEKQKQTTAKRQKHNIQNIKAKTLSSNWSSLIDRVKAMAYWVTITPLTKRKLRFSVSSLIRYRMF